VIAPHQCGGKCVEKVHTFYESVRWLVRCYYYDPGNENTGLSIRQVFQWVVTLSVWSLQYLRKIFILPFLTPSFFSPAQLRSVGYTPRRRRLQWYCRAIISEELAKGP